MQVTMTEEVDDLTDLINNEENKGELVFIKFALDKVGISRNKREKKVIKEVYKRSASNFLVPISSDVPVNSFSSSVSSPNS